MLQILRRLPGFWRSREAKGKQSALRSELECLFGTRTEPNDIDALLNTLPCSEDAKTIAAIVLTYAGQRAVRLRDAIALGHRSTNGKWRTHAPQQIRCDFDPIFVETAALCFWSVMDKYWDDDEMGFWIEDDSPDEPYLATLTEALDLADDIIGKISKTDLRNYLYKEVRFYNETVDGERRQPIKKYAASVATWLCRRNDPESATARRLIQGLSLMTASEIDRVGLESLCRAGCAG